MLKEILILGIGGDGVQLTGNFLMNASLKKDYNVSFYPIYGSQMRGGESTLVIKISDKEIVNPMLSKPDIVAIVNDAHVNKYSKYIKDAELIDFTKTKIIKNKNIILLAKLIKTLQFIDKNDIYEQIEKKFKKEEVRNSIKECFDTEFEK